MTTRAAPTELAGRGVGLQIVREVAKQLEGKVTVESEPGRGTTVVLDGPVSLAAAPALLVEAGRFTASLPLDAVRATLRLTERDVARSPDGDAIAWEGRAVRFAALDAVVGGLARERPLPAADDAARLVVVIEAGGRTAAVGLDRLLGISTEIVRALPALADAVPAIAGASLDDEGDPRLALDPAALVDAVHATAGADLPEPAARRLPVLVVDDSLTSRMLEQTILESAGYDVVAAASAEEALERARQQRFSLFVVDVEMPGMNGFELVARTRADGALRDIPAILVTSRASRRRPPTRPRGRRPRLPRQERVRRGPLPRHRAEARRMTASRARVLVVEDSITVRKHLVEVLASDPGLEVAGEAADGDEAIPLCERLRPDVVTMDLVLPGTSGLAAIEHIMAYRPTPIVVVSVVDNRGMLFRVYDALAAGAVEVVEKPAVGESSSDWEERLRFVVRIASRVKVITHPKARLADLPPASSRSGSALSTGPRSERSPALCATVAPRLLALGASTGGPGAVLTILRALPASFSLPILLVVHVGRPFNSALATWLDTQGTGRRVAWATDGERLPEPGAARVVMAPAEDHLLVRSGRLRLTSDAERHSCRPSVDVLFESVARELSPRAIGVLLTGMGRDGAAGLLAMRRAGAATIAQDEATSVVYGMPRAAAEIGAAAHVLPLGAIAPFVARLAGESGGGR